MVEELKEESFVEDEEISLDSEERKDFKKGGEQNRKNLFRIN